MKVVNHSIISYLKKRDMYTVEVGFRSPFPLTAILKVSKLAYFCYIIFIIFIYYCFHYVIIIYMYVILCFLLHLHIYDKRQYSSVTIFCPVITLGAKKTLTRLQTMYIKKQVGKHKY